MIFFAGYRVIWQYLFSYPLWHQLIYCAHQKMIMYLWKVNIFIRLTAAMYKSRGIYFGSRPAKFPPTFAYIMQLRKVIFARMFTKFRHTHKLAITLYLPILQKKFCYFENIFDVKGFSYNPYIAIRGWKAFQACYLKILSFQIT